MPERVDPPIAIDILQAEALVFSRYDNHIVRRLSDMKGQFHDQEAYQAMLEEEDRILYEVYDVKRPEQAGELIPGLSIVHPGKVGDEYYMTKGHFHTVIDTAELYYCLRGEGMIVMETPAGEFTAERLKPHTLVYIPPRWSHRSVNTSPTESLATFFVYPANAGHDYGSIERRGFRKLVVERDGGPQLVDNPRWLPPEKW